MPRPTVTPVGLELSRAAKSIGRAFDERLAAAGGSQPMWLILISLKTRRLRNQRELAEAVGIQGATLTHHLNAMEADGLLTRRRDPDNRRVHLVELTEAGDAMFDRLRVAAVAHDEQLRTGLTDQDAAELTRLLGLLRSNVET